MKVACVLLLLVALAAPGFAQAPDDKLIVPGQRIGKWTLETTISRILELRGTPKYTLNAAEWVAEDQQTDIRVLSWPNANFMAATRDGTTVIYVAIASTTSYATSKGISCLKPRKAVEAAYGMPDVVTTRPGGLASLIYEKIGLAVLVDKTSIVKTIVVFRIGDGKKIWKRTK